MSSDHPIQHYTGIERGPLNKYFAVASGQTFVAFALVTLNTSTGEISECGADPATILGIVQSDAANAFLYDNRVPVQVLDPNVEYGLCVTGTLAATDVGKVYGLVKNASGNWAVDLSDTTNTRVVIVRADVTNQLAHVQFLAANLQLDAIAS